MQRSLIGSPSAPVAAAVKFPEAGSYRLHSFAKAAGLRVHFPGLSAELAASFNLSHNCVQ